ncbi:MAG: hypothetical protein ACREAB_04580, partial [Blastocatellia bacterium]
HLQRVKGSFLARHALNQEPSVFINQDAQTSSFDFDLKGCSTESRILFQWGQIGVMKPAEMSAQHSIAKIQKAKAPYFRRMRID